MKDLIAHQTERRRRNRRLVFVLTLAAAALGFWRLAYGEWHIPLPRVFELLFPIFGPTDPTAVDAVIVRSVRLPRLLAAMGTGGLLSVSGIVLQGLLGNPLAEPYTLGLAAGAAFGGALGFFLGASWVTPLAFVGAISSLWIVYAVAWNSRGGSANLVLAGIVANAFLSAGVTFLKAMADDRLGAIVLWLMGSFSNVALSAALSVWGAAALVLVPAWIFGRHLDAVSLGEGRGSLLGVDERRLRLILLCAASFSTAVAVSSFGIIGFVGLVVPHLLRMRVGPLHRPLLILGFLGGGCLLTLADGLAQRLGELPVGVVTALVGGPVFCRILMTRRTRP